MISIQKLRSMNLDSVADELESLRAFKVEVESQKPARITEQDMQEIANHIFGYIGVLYPESAFENWFSKFGGCELLNKLNADRKQVLDDAPAQKLWDYYQTLLKHYGFDGITDLLVKYRKLVEQVPAVSVPDEWRESLKEMVQAMRDYEMDVGEQAPEKHRRMMDTAEALLAAPSHSQQSVDSLVEFAAQLAKKFPCGMSAGDVFAEAKSFKLDLFPSHDSEHGDNA